MEKYYDCIGTEVKVGDSIVFAVYVDDLLELRIGEVTEIDISSITPVFLISSNKKWTTRRFKEEICYITTLDELGE